MNIETCISKSISHSELINCTKPPENSVVIVSGTLIEGLGNTHSDIDVFVFADDLPDVSSIGTRNFIKTEGDKVRQVFDALDDDGLCFDAEYYYFSEFNDIINKLDRLYLKGRATTKLLRQQMTSGEEDLIHKCSIGINIGERHISELVDIKAMREKFSFIKYRRLIGGYPEFKDIRGMYHANDMRTCYLAMREYVEMHAMALTYVVGDTNSKRKWLLKKLDRLPRQHNRIVKSINDWLFNDLSQNTEIERLILSGCDLIDDIYTEIRPYLNSNSGFYSLEDARLMVEDEYSKERIKDVQTKEEYQFRRRQFLDTVPRIRSYLVDEPTFL